MFVFLNYPPGERNIYALHSDDDRKLSFEKKLVTKEFFLNYNIQHPLIDIYGM